MCCVNKLLHGALVLAVLIVSGCNELTNDLDPSGEDKRPAVEANTIGYQPGQIAPDFTVRTTLDEAFTLSDYLNGGSQAKDAVVLYFTMWCPICLAHSDHIYNNLIPQFATRGDVTWLLVDYVSGSVVTARAAETANGYAGSAYTTLVDVDHTVMDSFNTAMGSVVVIGGDGTILLNEDYRSGDATQAVLEAYLP